MIWGGHSHDRAWRYEKKIEKNKSKEMFATTTTLIFAQETMSKYFMLLILSLMEIHNMAITKIHQNTPKYTKII